MRSIAKAWCILVTMIGILWRGFKETVAILAALAVVIGIPVAFLYFGIHGVARILDTEPEAVASVFVGILILAGIISGLIDLYRKARAQCND